MYSSIKKVFNLKNLANLITVLILLFSSVWFLFGEKFSFYVADIKDRITGAVVIPAYFQDFNGLEVLFFRANYYNNNVPEIFNIFSILMFLSLLFSIVSLIIYIVKKTNTSLKLKYISGLLFLITLVMFTVVASNEYIVGPNSSGAVLYTSLYLGLFILLTYDGTVILLKKYAEGSKADKDSKGYYVVTSTYKVLNVEEQIVKRFYSLKKSDKYIKKITSQNHTDIKIEKNN